MAKFGISVPVVLSFEKTVSVFASKRAFIAGVTDDTGYQWAITKSLDAAGAIILVGT